MRSTVSLAPFDFINLLIYFDRFEVVKFRGVRLKFNVEGPFASGVGKSVNTEL